MGINKLVFNGKVYLSPQYSEEMRLRQSNGDQSLFDLKEVFKIYWATGFHPDLGQDSHFAKPQEIRSLGVRKSHVRQDSHSVGYGWTSTKEAWDLWSSGTSKVKPASNSYLIYSVTENRDAIITTFIDDGAHGKCDQTEYMEGVISLTYTLFQKLKQKPMPIHEHQFLFDDRWLIDPANEEEAS